MIEKLVLATAITFALNIFLVINNLSAQPSSEAQPPDAMVQATSRVEAATW